MIAPDLTIEQAAERLNVSGRTIRRLLRKRKLKCIRIGRRTVTIPESAIIQFREANAK